VAYDKRRAERGIAGLTRLAARLRALRREARTAGARTEAAYLAQGSARSAALALLAGFRSRIGFTTSAGRWLYTERVEYRRDRHHAERLWRLAADVAAKPTAEQLRPRLFPGRAEHAAVDALLGENAHLGEPLVALAPGSVWATKRWPYFAQLAAALEPSWRAVVVGSADDAPLAREIVAATRGRAIDATGRLSLLGSAALLERCTALVTNDSAPQHLASATSTPTIAVFGPTVPAFGFGPLAPGSESVGLAALPCRPCDGHGPRECPLGHWRCMRELSVEMVASAVERLRHV
jgi:heptosyltransferase-2